MVRRLSSARSRLFRSFRSLSKLRLEGEGHRANSQQQQSARRKCISKCSPFSALCRAGCISSKQRAHYVLQKTPSVNLRAKDQPLCVFLSVGPAQEWRTGESVMLSYHQLHPQSLFLRLTLRCPGLLKGARVSTISGPTLLNSRLGTHSQGMERTRDT